MPLPQNTLRQLQTPDIGRVVLPKLVFPPLPEKLSKIDPEGAQQWLGKLQEAFDKWNEKLATAIRGGGP